MIGMLSLVVGFVIKLIPENVFASIPLFNTPSIDTTSSSDKPNVIHQMRRSRSIVSRSNSHR